MSDFLIRKDWAIDRIDANPNNPNEMTEEMFNMLYDNMDQMGFTDPMLVVPHPTRECNPETGEGWVMIIGGEHRWEVAKIMGYETVPVTINTDPEFDEDRQKFQIVRHNIIHGEMSPKKFLSLYESLSAEYSHEVAAEMFGFVDEDEFKRLINATAQSLPKDMQNDFKEAAKEIKSIDDLSKVLNHLFATYGDTLDYNYMIIDQGGKESLWLRCSPKEFQAIKDFAIKCKDRSRPVDPVLMKLVAQVDDEQFEDLIQGVEEVSVPEDKEVVTLDYVDEL